MAGVASNPLPATATVLVWVLLYSGQSAGLQVLLLSQAVRSGRVLVHGGCCYSKWYCMYCNVVGRWTWGIWKAWTWIWIIIIGHKSFATQLSLEFQVIWFICSVICRKSDGGHSCLCMFLKLQHLRQNYINMVCQCVLLKVDMRLHLSEDVHCDFDMSRNATAWRWFLQHGRNAAAGTDHPILSGNQHPLSAWIGCNCLLD